MALVTAVHLPSASETACTALTPATPVLPAQFLECCKGLIGSRKDWKDSLFLKITIAVALKALVGFVLQPAGSEVRVDCITRDVSHKRL